MNFLLDTCVISELAKKTPNENVLKWIENKDERCLYLSVVTLGEIQKGISKLSDKKRQIVISKWLHDDLIARFFHRILDINTAVSITWGEIQREAGKKGELIPVIDGLIIATAIVNNMQVVTRNTKDFKESINPWN